ncbi:ATP-synthase delta-subunit [Auriculariales sp. MPI-PUGE-AT-0066]|nr:ATP-synthase delta-subunit [Auriculariales sp. MPI-PUGE-AT-0066]
MASHLLRASARRGAIALAQSQRRGYAEVSDKIKLSLVLPHQARLFRSRRSVQVNIAAATGDMGILANHVPSVEALRPGLIEVVEATGSKKYFASGGFAIVHPNNKLTINAVEAAPLEDFSAEAVRSNLAEALKIVNGNGSEEDKLEARVEADVYEAIQAALGKQ